MGTIVAVLSGKGGVGKTTVSASLAGAIAERGAKVLLTDGDLGLRDLDLVVGKEDEVLYDAVDLWQGNCTEEEAILKLADNLDFLPASQTNVWEDLGRKGYRRMIKDLADVYDYVVVDAPAGIGRGTQLIAQTAHRMIVVTEPVRTSMRNAERLMRILDAERRFDYAVVINRILLEEDGETTGLKDAIAYLDAERWGTFLPWSNEVRIRGDAGTLHELSSHDIFRRMLVPLADFAETGESRDETELLAAFAAVKLMLQETERGEESAEDVRTSPIAVRSKRSVLWRHARRR